jgi:hypothetical protein
MDNHDFRITMERFILQHTSPGRDFEDISRPDPVRMGI